MVMVGGWRGVGSPCFFHRAHTHPHPHPPLETTTPKPHHLKKHAKLKTPRSLVTLQLHDGTKQNKRYREFWLAQSRALERLYGSRLATAAAVRGACPAGGCCVALCCDARFLTPNAKMGLNEVALGIPVPKFWAELLARAAGPAAAERLVLSGRMFGAREALALGVADGVAASDS